MELNQVFSNLSNFKDSHLNKKVERPRMNFQATIFQKLKIFKNISEQLKTSENLRCKYNNIVEGFQALIKEE